MFMGVTSSLLTKSVFFGLPSFCAATLQHYFFMKTLQDVLLKKWVVFISAHVFKFAQNVSCSSFFNQVLYMLRTYSHFVMHGCCNVRFV